ncbi:MAG: flagellar basal body L-ring protein FlgH [Gammaproteobacteria bacterium CG22_combo_CG10-13_8_21_14_all_40_8]|nr:MAG: flagellar basal body L-ring protein FlgH [Gammaproteobacteria bacterium CG22_combo_CG10-13_8_21_14_all_40_8]
MSILYKLISFSLIASSMAILLSSCTAIRGPIPNDPMFAPVYPTQAPVPQSTPGAIYNPATAKFLFEDFKAKRVGDMLMVKLVESTNAKKNADTSLKKDDSVSIPDPTLFGIAGGAAGLLNNRLNQSYEPQRQFDGQSDTKQSNQLTGDITVTVMQVLPNGYLSVRGEKWITLNQGREYIRLTGLVRPQDITADNQLLSNRLGNARIEYSGTGALAAVNQQGWLSRFFSSSWWPL